MTPPRLTIVVPCYNEEPVLDTTHARLAAKLTALIARGAIAPDSHALYVDDGSRDRTWAVIARLCSGDPLARGLKLAGNRGHQAALLAGLFHAAGDVTISIDADLQDDVDAMDAMLAAHATGHHVVFGVRNARPDDTAMKKGTALAFYKVMAILGAPSVYNHADFRLMSRLAVDGLRDYPESNLFLRSLVYSMGLKSTSVMYDRGQRLAGESKYPLSKMLAFAWEGITSFSVVPLRLVTTLGAAIFGASLALSIWAVYVRIFTDDAVPGWTSSVVPSYLLGGIQLMGLGIVGEYVGKIYRETKRRPRYMTETKM